MNDLLRPITDRTQPPPAPQRPLLSDADYQRVEYGLVTSQEMMILTCDRLRTENERLRAERDALIRLRDHLSAENAALRAENATLNATIATRAAQSLRDRERLINAETAHTMWLGGLALVTAAAVIVTLSMIR